MSIAQVRAALPNVAWDNPREDGDPNDPTVARAKKAPIGDESFDINYVDGSWGAFSLGLDGKSPGTSDQCRQRILKFLAAVEAANGTLGAKPAKPGFTGRTETIRFGKSSEGRALSIATPSGEDGYAITAERKAGHVEVDAVGAYAPGSTLGGQGVCALAAGFSSDPPRPPPMDLPFEALSIVRDVSIGVKHHSLDLLETPRDTTVTFECTFGKYGELLCPDRSTRNLRAAARRRVNDMRIARRTKDGRWTPYQRTVVPVHFSASDRVAITQPVDTSKQQLLIQTLHLTNAPRFPDGAINSRAGAVVDIGCTVQIDGSLVCTEFKVTPSGKYDAEFGAEAARAMTGRRFAPKLKDGTPSLGVGYRSTVEFRIQ